MHWTDTAIVLSIRKHGESSAIAHLFTEGHGLHGGVLRGATSKANRGVAQPGNIVNADWNARLSEQIGSLKCELAEAHAAHLMHDGAKLACLTATCALLEAALPERHPYPRLWRKTVQFLRDLQDSPDWQQAHVKLELDILSECGFGLDLTECAGTGSRENLTYVSPKSGRAVSQHAGRPYHDKLLPLPEFLLAPSVSGKADILSGLHLTSYFLEHWLLEPQGRKMPATRLRYLQMLRSKTPVPA